MHPVLQIKEMLRLNAKLVARSFFPISVIHTQVQLKALYKQDATAILEEKKTIWLKHFAKAAKQLRWHDYLQHVSTLTEHHNEQPADSFTRKNPINNPVLIPVYYTSIRISSAALLTPAAILTASRTKP